MKLAKCAIQVVFGLLLLTSCSEEPAPASSPSVGQVAPVVAAPKVSFYAASRFAEQATFGPTPALVAEIQAKGFETWIDDQFALAVSQIDPGPVSKGAPGTEAELNAYPWTALGALAMTAADQLRLRTSWSLMLFVANNGNRIGQVNWANLVLRHAFGNYGAFLRDVTIDPSMGAFLNNVQNRPRSAECLSCAPNENYARELMQLFSLGLYRLNGDGTPELDVRGRKIETYRQSDVEELARALTGWQFDSRDPEDIWSRPLIPSPVASEHDRGAKSVLGHAFAAGQSQQLDLDDTVALLMAHQNIAPFVGLRLIQHLVMSHPSPAYVGRVAARFRNNGAGMVGDMKAVIKVVLLDAEARRGDNPASAAKAEGKYREPFLWHWHFFRAIGCRRPLYTPRNDGLDPFWEPRVQVPFRVPSVFSWYQAGDRSAGSATVAPEQRLVTPSEIASRFSALSAMLTRQGERPQSIDIFDRSGCDLVPLVQAYDNGPRAFTELVSAKFFRGAMPSPVRRTIEEMMVSPEWTGGYSPQAMLDVLGWALSTPYFGVML